MYIYTYYIGRKGAPRSYSSITYSASARYVYILTFALRHIEGTHTATWALYIHTAACAEGKGRYIPIMAAVCVCFNTYTGMYAMLYIYTLYASTIGKFIVKTAPILYVYI